MNLKSQIKKESKSCYKKRLKEALKIYNKYKDRKLFNLLWDFRHTLLPFEFMKAGISFGHSYDKDPIHFMYGISNLIGYHIMDDGGIRYNKEEVEKYDYISSCWVKYVRNDLGVRKEEITDEEYRIGKQQNDNPVSIPSWFTMRSRDNKDYLNGDGDNEDAIYNHCIEYLRKYFRFMSPDNPNVIKIIRSDISLPKHWGKNAQKNLDLIRKYNIFEYETKNSGTRSKSKTINKKS